MASVVPNDGGGLLRDLSLYPSLLPSGFATYLGIARMNAEQLSNANSEVAQQRLLSTIRGLDELGSLVEGQMATPITPIVSNLMMAFSVHLDTVSNERLYLRMRFFCELWNPFTSSLSMNDAAGNALDLELEISGLPTVRITKGVDSSASSALVNLQSILGRDSADTDSPMVIVLKNDVSESLQMNL